MSTSPFDQASRAARYRANPIYGTDLNRPMSKVVKELRDRMTTLRGQIQDFQFGFPGWRERTEPVEGLLTCGIVTLYSVLQELEKFEAEQKPIPSQGSTTKGPTS